MLERLTKGLDLFLKVFDRESKLQFSLGEGFCEVADDVLSLLDLRHVSLCQLLDLVLMNLVQLVKLVLRFFLADD